MIFLASALPDKMQEEFSRMRNAQHPDTHIGHEFNFVKVWTEAFEDKSFTAFLQFKHQDLCLIARVTKSDDLALWFARFVKMLYHLNFTEEEFEQEW